MLKLYATYHNLLRCCLSLYGDGRQHNATCRENLTELNLCGTLHPSTYDDAVCVNAEVEINVLDYNVGELW